MELVEISKTKQGKGEIKLLIAGKLKRYEFAYFDDEIFAVDFPEDLKKILRILSPRATRSLVEKIKHFTHTDPSFLKQETKFEKELLALV
jgi:hypothetical protein